MDRSSVAGRGSIIIKMLTVQRERHHVREFKYYLIHKFLRRHAKHAVYSTRVILPPLFRDGTAFLYSEGYQLYQETFIMIYPFVNGLHPKLIAFIG